MIQPRVKIGLQDARTRRAQAGMRIAKCAMSIAARAVLNHDPDAAELAEKARVLLMRADSLRQLAQQSDGNASD